MKLGWIESKTRYS